MRVDPQPQMHQRLAEFLGHRVSRHQRAPGSAVAERCRTAAQYTRAQCRPDAVGADQGDALIFHHVPIAVRLHGETIGVGRKVLDAGRELDCDVLRLLRGIGERYLQVAAMDRPIGRAIAALGVRPERNTHDLVARAAGHHADRLRRNHQGREALAQAERDQHAGGIGSELNSGAGLFQSSGLLEHGDAQAGARQRQRRRQPRDPGAGDDDVTRGRQDLKTPILDQAAADIGKAHSGGRAACGSSLESNR